MEEKEHEIFHGRKFYILKIVFFNLLSPIDLEDKIAVMHAIG